MCLSVDINKHPEGKPKVAKEDIICYKVLKKLLTLDGESFGQSFFSKEYIWYINKVKKEELEEKMTVNYGLHAFLYEDMLLEFLVRNNSSSDSATTISTSSNGSWNEMKCAKVNAKMIIPKGAKYYFGDKNDIVADQMKLIEFL